MAPFDSVPACRIEVRNEVPLARGLGSSSAAAVARLALGAILRMRMGRESGRTSRGRVAGSAGPHRPTGADATDEIDRIVLLELANELEGHRQVRYELARPWPHAGGTSLLVLEPLDFLRRLAALPPGPAELDREDFGEETARAGRERAPP